MFFSYVATQSNMQIQMDAYILFLRAEPSGPSGENVQQKRLDHGRLDQAEAPGLSRRAVAAGLFAFHIFCLFSSPSSLFLPLYVCLMRSFIFQSFVFYIFFSLFKFFSFSFLSCFWFIFPLCFYAPFYVIQLDRLSSGLSRAANYFQNTRVHNSFVTTGEAAAERAGGSQHAEPGHQQQL
jgi:hypothetical protein